MSLLPITQIEESDYGDELWFGGDGCGLISVGEWYAGGCKSSRPQDWSELKRQTNLIAAAPDLLEALEHVESMLTADSSEDIDYRKVVKAIAKARGKQS